MENYKVKFSESSNNLNVYFQNWIIVLNTSITVAFILDNELSQIIGFVFLAFYTVFVLCFPWLTGFLVHRRLQVEFKKALNSKVRILSNLTHLKGLEINNEFIVCFKRLNDIEPDDFSSTDELSCLEAFINDINAVRISGWIDSLPYTYLCSNHTLYVSRNLTHIKKPAGLIELPFGVKYLIFNLAMLINFLYKESENWFLSNSFEETDNYIKVVSACTIELLNYLSEQESFKEKQAIARAITDMLDDQKLGNQKARLIMRFATSIGLIPNVETLDTGSFRHQACQLYIKPLDNRRSNLVCTLGKRYFNLGLLIHGSEPINQSINLCIGTNRVIDQIVHLPYIKLPDTPATSVPTHNFYVRFSHNHDGDDFLNNDINCEITRLNLILYGGLNSASMDE